MRDSLSLRGRVWRSRDGEYPARLGSVAALKEDLLLQRGLSSPELREAFLHPRLSQLPGPDFLPNLEEGAERLLRALEQGERVAVHGDYDADGITSTALLCEFLSALGIDTLPFLPNRMRDGYGLRVHNVERLREQGCTVLVLCDIGSSAHQEIARAHALGMDVIVCDHHQIPPEGPPDHAILINPQLGSNTDAQGLCAAGVSFYLVLVVRSLLRKQGKDSPEVTPLLDLVALGTVADLAPLTGTNRVLVAAGLEVLGRRKRPGLAAMLADAGLRHDHPPSAQDLGFKLGPRINVAGRIADPGPALSLLRSRDHAQAQTLSRSLLRLNQERQAMDRKVVQEARIQARERGGVRGYVLWDSAWHTGVVGIAAARLMDELQRPVFLFGGGEDGFRGSGRAMPGVNLHQALLQVAPLLERWGGHPAAAGATVLEENLPALREWFEGEAFAAVPEEVWTPSLRVDGVIPPELVGEDLLCSIGELAPFGRGNPEPLLVLEKMKLFRAQDLSKEGLRFVAAGGGLNLSCIGFGLGVCAADLSEAAYDLAVQVRWDRHAARNRLECWIKDLRPSR